MSIVQEPTESSDRLLQFCGKCGRVLGHRITRNVEWVGTVASSRKCDWGD
ncbi:MAG TPA: hypothetical protein VFF67_09930 [Thermoplasmata archaeon]|nr:hypothetical protein [Thermoplasmata archaeon]